MLLSDAIELFLKKNRLKGNSLKTLYNYERFLFYFVEYTGQIDTSHITLNLLEEYQLYLMCREFHSNHIRKNTKDTQLTKTTVQSYIRHLRVFLNFLYRENIIDEDITVRFRLPKAPKKLKTILNESQIIEIFNNFNDDFLGFRNLCIIASMIDSGLRVSETANLRLQDVDLYQNTIKVHAGKGEKDRIVPLGEYTKKFFIIYIENYRLKFDVNTDFMFLTREGKLLSANAIQNFVYRLKKKYGYDKLHPHLFRHTFATKFLINGGDIFSLQMILGHSDLEMVKNYSHLANSYMLSKHRKYSPLDVMKKSELSLQNV